MTLWKHNTENITEPFHLSDNFHFVVIVCFINKLSGKFIFPSQVLADKGILSSVSEGKRGFRVYPAWDRPISKQAIKTQEWQSQYFSSSLNIDTKTLRYR